MQPLHHCVSTYIHLKYITEIMDQTKHSYIFMQKNGYTHLSLALCAGSAKGQPEKFYDAFCDAQR
jgi:hypothetical protein